jgi:hypothetical protein
MERMMDFKLPPINKKLTGVGLIIIVLVVGGAILIWRFQKIGPLVTPIGEQTEEAEALAWEDQAGFSFLYPEEIEIDPHEEDAESYAHLELTSADHPGRILIWVKETDYQDIGSWADEEASPGGQILDTQLGEESAKKIAYSDPEKLVVAAIDVDALVLLEMEPGEEGYWQEIFDQILESFAFIPIEGEEVAEPAEDGGASAGSGVIWEVEEVIE